MLSLNASLIGALLGSLLLVSEYLFYLHIIFTRKRIKGINNKLKWIGFALLLFLTVNIFLRSVITIDTRINYGGFLWPFAYGYFIYKTQPLLNNKEEE